MIGDTPAPSSASIPAPMPVFAVEGHGLVKTFGNFRAVDGVDIAVPAGAIYGILGPNGAGKTTLLRTLLGIVDPDAGERRLLGASQPLRMARQVGYLPEERGLYPSMKAFEAIAFMGALRGLPLAEGRRRAKALLEDHGMGAAIAKPIRQLSKGMAQTVQLFGTIVHEPRLIVLDEPFSGLDAINQEKLEALIREQARRGVTILFSTHVIAHAERLCERVAIIAGGRIRFDGTVSEARDRAGEIAGWHLGMDNFAVIMARSGARGSMLNLSQMAGSIGQQAIRGERVSRGYNGRTLSHFNRDDLGAEARGFVRSSYKHGLNPTEYFFHSMGGREGLVDTAVRTSRSGYMQRRLVNALEDWRVKYDHTVRNPANPVVQFRYGEDGIDPTRSKGGEGVDVESIVSAVAGGDA